MKPNHRGVSDYSTNNEHISYNCHGHLTPFTATTTEFINFGFSPIYNPDTSKNHEYKGVVLENTTV